MFQVFIHTETINWNLLWGNYLRHPINKGVVTRVACHSVCTSPLTHFIHITSSSSANWSSVWKNVILDVWKVLNKIWYKKVKCTLVQALRLCTGRTAHRGSRGLALPIHDYGTKRGWGVSVTPWPLFTPGKDLVPIVQETGWAPGPV